MRTNERTGRLESLRPAKREVDVDYNVVIDFVSGGEVANLLKGYILVKGSKIRFTGVAYGRFGGQNVFPKFSPVARQKAASLFGNMQALEEDLQLRLVNGDFEIKPPKQDGAKSR